MNNRYNRLDDLEKVFDNRWKANNNNYNGVKERVEANNEHFNKMFNIKSKEERKKEIRYANSVEGQVERLNNNMKLFNNRNNFR